MLQILSQDETPLLYSLVFGEGVVNDATSVVLFNAIQSIDLSNIDARVAIHFLGSFFYLFSTSTLLGVFVSSLAIHQSLFTVLYGNCLLNHTHGFLAGWAAECLYNQKVIFWQVYISGIVLHLDPSLGVFLCISR